jgi:DNA repair protein RecN (Recombination protein N)
VIEELRISSLGVIAETTLPLGPGLNVITGETGAGKTMLVNALGLLLGQRADPGGVRTGAKAARVEGLFSVDEAQAMKIDEIGGEVEDGALLIARQVAAEGRSRAFIGGAAAPASALIDLGQTLVAVHGQADQHRLLRPEVQLEVLDRFAGAHATTALAAYQTVFDQLKAVEAQLRDVVTYARERAREADLLRHGLAEIQAVDPVPGEADELAAEERRLGFADELRSAAEQAHTALSSDNGGDAVSALGAARRILESVQDHDPIVKELGDRAVELTHLASDLASDIASYSSGIETDPLRLAAVSQRRAALNSLTRKYADSLADVLAWAEAAQTRLALLDSDDESIEELRSQRLLLRDQLATHASELSRVRAQAAQRIGIAVTEELSGLAMTHATLRVSLSSSPDAGGLETEAGHPVRFTRTGVDEASFELAANVGADYRPLGRGASGGELSRVMLAVEVVLSATSPVPTMIFDEVDAGVGGKAAVEVGKRLAQLAQHVQVLCVTHLPQVAAYADQHLVVRKSDDGLVTDSGVDVLDDSGRVRELSRMLAGLEASASAQAHAEELLRLARAVKQTR